MAKHIVPQFELHGPIQPTYNAVHYWLRITRGPANTYWCDSCDECAAHWAYTNDDDMQMWRDSSPYSLMCRACHKTMDNYARTPKHAVAFQH